MHLYTAEKGRLYTWMVTIARNVAISSSRSKAYVQETGNIEIGEAATDVDNLHSTNLNIDLLGVRELIDLLRDDQRDLLQLICFQGYTMWKRLNIWKFL